MRFYTINKVVFDGAGHLLMIVFGLIFLKIRSLILENSISKISDYWGDANVSYNLSSVRLNGFFLMGIGVGFLVFLVLGFKTKQLIPKRKPKKRKK